MSAELAHQKADTHLCVALHRKVRIRLHPLREPFVIWQTKGNNGRSLLWHMFIKNSKKGAIFFVK